MDRGAVRGRALARKMRVPHSRAATYELWAGDGARDKKVIDRAGLPQGPAGAFCAIVLPRNRSTARHFQPRDGKG